MAMSGLFTNVWNRHWLISVLSNQKLNDCAYMLQYMRSLVRLTNILSFMFQIA